MPRKIPEWIAKHDDQSIPPKVRLRVFDKHKGICGLSDVKINIGDKWDIDHIKALWDGGEHREGNLQPALRKAHREKSGREKTEKAESDRLREKYVGIIQPKGKIQSRPKPGKKQPLISKTSLPRRNLYE